MTIKEALEIKTRPLSLEAGVLDLAILEADLIGTAEYDPKEGKAVDLVWIGLLLTTIRVTEVKEDDVSLKFTGDLRGIVSALCLKWGIPDPFAPAKPTVKQKLIW
jgi:hypothetical protein